MKQQLALFERMQKETKKKEERRLHKSEGANAMKILVSGEKDIVEKSRTRANETEG